MKQDYSHLYGAPPVPPMDDAYNQPVGSVPEEPPRPFVFSSADAPQPVQPEDPPRAAVFRSSDMSSAAPLPPPRPMPAPKPAKPKQPFSPTSLLLIAGVAFLFLGGILFLTQTWATLADSARAIVLLSVSVIFFGANVVSEKVFRLPKTGLAFYILGCIFLPMAVAGIGVFRLWGEWFSFQGEGSALVAAVVFACVAVSTAIGVKSYHHPVLAWLSLISGALSLFALGVFGVNQVTPEYSVRISLFAVWYLLICGGVWFWARREHCRGSETVYGRASHWFSYFLMLFTALMYFVMVLSKGGAHLVPAASAAVLCVGFLPSRYETKNNHVGMFGAAFCLMTVLYAPAQLAVFDGIGGDICFAFAAAGAGAVLLTLCSVPKFPEKMQKTAGFLGILLMTPLVFCGIQPGKLFMLYLLELMSLLFVVTEKNPIHKKTRSCMVFAVAVFLLPQCGMNGKNAPLFMLLLVIFAALLLVQALLVRKLWCIVLACCSAGGMLILHLPQPLFCLLCLYALITLTGVIYAHITRRPLLEKCFALCFIPFFLTALSNGLMLTSAFQISPAAEGDAVSSFLRSSGSEMLLFPTMRTVVMILVFTAVTLLYLLESAAFSRHERTQGLHGTRFYLELTASAASLLALAAYLIDKNLGVGFGILLLVQMGVYAFMFLRRKINLWAVLPLVEMLTVADHMICMIDAERVRSWEILPADGMTPDNFAALLKFLCFVVLVVGFAAAGRLLLPKFCERDEDGTARLDLPLLMSAICIIRASQAVDWYPALLVCLFLTLYSLLFIGRVENRRIPALLASIFGCLTILLHNIYDPFSLLDQLSVLDIKTLRIILYLLPFHLFILTMLYILPREMNRHVHLARFMMYCVTMATLVIASICFRNVTDAIVLVVFSFLILVGSFVSRKLRWFTLGFAVLVIMTVNLTWTFWKSLHWGIYLFLAGILLIALASVYEYSARYAREHPDEPKKKLTLFADWKW